MEATLSLQEAEKSLERALSAGQNRPDRLPGLQVIFGQLPRIMVEEVGSLSFFCRSRFVSSSFSASTDRRYMRVACRRFFRRRPRREMAQLALFIADPAVSVLFVEAATGCESIPSGRSASAQADPYRCQCSTRSLSPHVASADSRFFYPDRCRLRCRRGGREDRSRAATQSVIARDRCPPSRWTTAVIWAS